ncbi:MAG: DNA repair protein RecN [Brevinemataceae bacterium]
MLERIAIQNFAVISNLEISFYKGFSVFTGETGAGKSVLIGALGLLLGGRSDSSMIRTDKDIMFVEGEFLISDNETKNFLFNNNIDIEDSLIIRREIHRNGKNRIFINSKQETLTKLEEIGVRLADMHGQHDHQLLLNKKVHGDILDSFGKLKTHVNEFSEFYQHTISKLEQKNILITHALNLKKDKEFYQNAYQEISQASFQTDEEETLQENLNQAQHREKILTALTHAYQCIHDAEINASLMLDDAKKSLQSISSFAQKYEELTDILEDASAKTKESAHLLSSYIESWDINREELDEILDRQALLKELKRKYQKNTVDELNNFKEECLLLIDKAENLDLEMELLENECLSAVKTLGEKSLELSKLRQTTALEMSKKIEQELSFLGMEGTRFEVKITYTKQEDSFLILNNMPLHVSDKGIDRIEFMIAANVGEEPKPLSKTASGGEISRIMLALKTALSQNDPVNISIFDEIDAGIGGMISHNVAVKIKELSLIRQVFCITHLAQIAAKSDHHYQISKFSNNSETFTSIKKLDYNERIQEIARMLGSQGQNSEKLARELLQDQ